MTVTSILFFVAMRDRLGVVRAGLLSTGFLMFDLAFLGANVAKIPTEGGFRFSLQL